MSKNYTVKVLPGNKAFEDNAKPFDPSQYDGKIKLPSMLLDDTRAINGKATIYVLGITSEEYGHAVFEIKKGTILSINVQAVKKEIGMPEAWFIFHQSDDGAGTLKRIKGNKVFRKTAMKLVSDAGFDSIQSIIFQNI